jgi:hypothetical protein
MLVFSPIISVRLSSLHLSGEGLGKGALCVFAPLRALRETKRGLNRFASLRILWFKVNVFSLCVFAPLRALRETKNKKQ